MYRCFYCQDDEYGFDEGQNFSLSEFQLFANLFKSQWFAAQSRPELSHSKSMHLSLTNGDEEVKVEREFWRLAADVFEDVEIEYGAGAGDVFDFSLSKISIPHFTAGAPQPTTLIVFPVVLVRGKSTLKTMIR